MSTEYILGRLTVPAPRCDSCKHWCPVVGDWDKQIRGDCKYLFILTKADFGCVEWEAK